MKAPRPSHPVLIRLFLVAFGLALALGGLALTEGVLRLLDVGGDSLHGDPFVGFAAGRELFEETTLASGAKVHATRDEKLPYFNYQHFPISKAPGTFRIFTLGGSTTAGRPYDDRVSFSAWLRLYLDDMNPERGWEVINAGAISYASYRIVLLMKELVRYSPDLFVVYTGHNEFLEERAYPPLIHRRPALKRTWIWLNGWRSYSLGRKLFQDLRRSKPQRSELAAEVTTKPDDWTGIERYHRNEDLNRSIVAHFEYNLEQMATIAARNDVEIIFVRPISNLKDFSPFKSEHGSGIDADQRARVRDLLDRGQQLLEAGDIGQALMVLAEAGELDPDYAETHFALGRARLAAGEASGAEESFVRAKDLDVAPLRALEEMTELVGTVARRRGVPLIDLPARLREESQDLFGHPILGSEYLLDHVHPDLPVHSRIAEEVIGVMRKAGRVDVTGGWSEQRRRALYESALASLDRRYYAERDLNLAKVLGWAGKTAEAEEPLRRAASVLTDHPDVPLHLGVLLQKQGRFAEAAVELERAASLDPESAPAYLNLGVVFAGLNRVEDGIAALRRALELRPGYPEALYNLGVLLGRSERPEQALVNLQRALAERPATSEIYHQLGLNYRRLERWDDATAAFAKALELDPQAPATLAALGSVHARRGNYEEGMRWLLKAQEADPKRAETHFELAWTLARQGRNPEAIARYEAAVAADPSYARAHNNLGILLASTGDAEGAIRSLSHAAEIQPDYADALFNLGIAYDSAGRPSEAERSITRALELEPDNARYHLALGMLLLARGESDRGGGHLARAETLGAEVPPELGRTRAKQ